MPFGRLERREGAQPMADINVTPLVDVMLVLLVIFIITAPLMAGSLRMDLPHSESAEPGLPSESIQLALTPDGQIHLDERAVTPEQLRQALTRRAAQDPDTEVQLRADAQVPYGKVVELMDMAQAAGLSRIGFVAERKPAR
ncbi:ExbD/TolR family protein [Pseudorhodoferax sp.]|uniref:ExbD/TolR family protein n=1 Tax=Pseudorhodoferax sp. TaxID=1993553 RepID=UPI002DD63B0A|nr:biopolymer transporter ExbD [Pseudorhodoferax sp.]